MLAYLVPFFGLKALENSGSGALAESAASQDFGGLGEVALLGSARTSAYCTRSIVGGMGALAAVDVRAEGALVRHAPEFAPAGTNVDFAAVTGPRELAIRTYERGVEDETAACGTGSIAAAGAAWRSRARRRRTRGGQP